MRLSGSTILYLAQIICGRHGTSATYDWPNFPYRSSSYLTRFFAACDLPYAHDGSTRLDWVSEVLNELNEGPSSNPDLPSDRLMRVIYGILEPLQFKRQGLDHQLAVADVNKVLEKDGLQVHFVHGQCTIENLKTRSTSAQTISGRLMTREEIERQEAFTQFLQEASEDEFTEKLLVPLFKQLGFERVRFSGHRDKLLEFGKDLWMKYRLPTGHWLYIGAQVKKGKIGAASSELSRNIGAVLTQSLMLLMYPVFDSETNSKHLVDHILLITSGEISKQAREFLSEVLDNGMRRNVLFLDRDELLELCITHSLPLPDEIETEADEEIPF